MSAAVQLPPLPLGAAPVKPPESVGSTAGEAGAANDFEALMEMLQMLSGSVAAPANGAMPSENGNPRIAIPAELPAPTVPSAAAPLPAAAAERGVASELVAPSPEPESANTLAKMELAVPASPALGGREEILGVPTVLRPELQQAASVAIPREAAAPRVAEPADSERPRANSRLPRSPSVLAASVSSEPAVSESSPALSSPVTASDEAGSKPTARHPREMSSSPPLEGKAAGLSTPLAESAPAAQNSDSVAQNALVQETRGGVDSAPRKFETPAEAAIAQRVSWLTSRGGGTARVVLHPAELGEVEISVRVRGNRVDVAIQTEVAGTRIALMESRDALNESFAARELRIESLDVRVAEPRPSAGSDGNSLGSSGRETAFNQASTDRGSQQQDNDGEGQNGNPTQRGTPGVDRFQESTLGERAQTGHLDLHV